MPSDPFGLCARCGERLGAYEPLVLEFPDGTVLHGGYLALSDRLAPGAEAKLQHARCPAPVAPGQHPSHPQVATLRIAAAAPSRPPPGSPA